MKTCNKCNLCKPITEFYKDISKRDGRHTICKECCKISKRKYYEDNKAMVLYKVTKRAECNKDRKAKYDKQYTKATAAYQELRRRNYYLNNIDKIKKRVSEYTKTDMGKIASKKARARRRFIKAQMSDGTVPSDPRVNIDTSSLIELLVKQNYKCPYCNSNITISNSHIDHIVPLSKGGKHSIFNLQFTCPTCNLRKGNKLNWNPNQDPETLYKADFSTCKFK